MHRTEVATLRWLPGPRFGLPAYLLFVCAVAALVYFADLPLALSTVAAIPLPIAAARWPRAALYAAGLGLALVASPLAALLDPDPVDAVQRTLIQLCVLLAMAEGVRAGVRGWDRATRALAASEERYRLLVETSNVIPWAVELPSLRLRYVGPQAEKLLGYSPEAWYGEGFFFDHVHPQDRNEVLARGRQQTARSEDHVLEFRMLAADGGIVWVRDFVTVATDDTGSPIGLSGVLIDITRERQTRLELRKSNERLSRIWAAARDGIVLLDETGDTVIEASPSAAQLVGYAEEELVGMPVSQLLPHEPEIAEATLRQIRQRGSARFEADLMMAGSNTSIPVEIMGSRVTIGGEGRILAIVRDLRERREADTARRRLESQMQEAQKLESLGRLAGGIAHDFNNLLTVILGNASLMLGGMDSEDENRGPLEDLDLAARRAGELTHQMLAFSGRASVDVRTEDLSQIALETAKLLSAGISKKLRLSLDLSKDPVWVEADAGQLHQVVMNLMTNAVDAIGAGSGNLSMATGIAEVDAASLARSADGAPMPPGRYAFVEVRDDGAGLDGDTLRRMFEPFFTTKRRGRGLGLAAVHGIVRAHAGGLWVETAPGSGTRVQVLLPLAGAPAAVETPPGPTDPLPAPEAAQRCVLVVDDEPAVRRIACRALTRRGFAVVEAEGGLEALDRVRADPEIAVAVVDLSMPGLSGLETLARLRELRPGLPVLLMSGYGEQEVTGRDAAVPATGFLHKPFRADEIADRVESLLD